MADKPKEENVRTYSFTTEELGFLAPRQDVLNKTAVINGDTRAIMDSFIIQNVLPRISIDPEKNEINFDIGKGTLTVSPKIILANAEPTPTIKKPNS